MVKTATVQTIAELAGVSIATVSYALNNTGNISFKTRERIIKIAQDVGYVTNVNEHLMKTRHYGNIGVVFNIFKGSYYYSMLEALTASISCRHKYGLHVIIGQKTERRIIDSILDTKLDAVIILNEKLEDSAIYKLKNRGIPMVFLDREIEDEMISSVLTDNVMGITDVMEYLIACGHKRIAFMRGDMKYNDGMRYKAYVNAMKRHSLMIEPSLIMQANFDEIYARSVFLNSYSSMNTFPDAVCCANDAMARGVIKALNTLGFNVPFDISVTGFDDSLENNSFSIPLTTVKNPISRIANIAVSEVFRLMQNDSVGKKILVDTEFVKRESCAIRNTRITEEAL